MKKVFIVPYRDRAEHKEIFLNHMRILLKDEKDYEIIFVHQTDKRKFNRGGMRNIGFIYVKNKYKNWKDITLIFHDIDYLPFKKLFSYNVLEGEARHFYGLKPAFGGIWGIKGKDFEKIGGFPNYWAWGFEDNKIRSKWLKSGGKINYDEFIEYTDSRVVKLDCSNYGHDTRTVNKNNLWLAQNEKYPSGYHTIRDLKYEEKEIDKNSKMINVKKFFTERKESSEVFIENVNQKQIVSDYNFRVSKLKVKTNFDSSKPTTWKAKPWNGLGFSNIRQNGANRQIQRSKLAKIQSTNPKSRNPRKKIKRRKKITLNLMNRKRI